MCLCKTMANNYQQEAERLTDAIQENFWDPKARKYRASFPVDEKALPYDFMWANGVQFSALVGGIRANSRKYAPLAIAFFEGLNDYWDTRAPIRGYDAYLSSPGNSDKYYDDNAWMVLTFAEAFALTRERRYRDRAIETLRYVLSGWDDKLGGGIYWRQDHKSKNTCSNAPSAVAALQVSAFDDKRKNVEWAERIQGWESRSLQAPNGAYWDNISLEGKIERTQWTYNSALALRADLGLYRATGDKWYLDEAKRIARASETVFVNPKTQAFRDDALFSHHLVEAFLDLYTEIKEPYLLDRARKNADFALTLRDPKDNLYFAKWDIVPNRSEERKTLIANAGVSRLLWLVGAVTG